MEPLFPLWPLHKSKITLVFKGHNFLQRGEESHLQNRTSALNTEKEVEAGCVEDERERMTFSHKKQKQKNQKT